jgi:hypothetical protein
MSAFYELLGRLIVRLLRDRYRRQLRAAAAVGVAAILAAGYVAITREPPEG